MLFLFICLVHISLISSLPTLPFEFVATTVCRTRDLYLTSKVSGTGAGQRPKLNLTVKKELKDGLIMAQSGMAKGPDGTCGFVDGWTKRKSPYAPPPTEEESLAAEAGNQTPGVDDTAPTTDVALNVGAAEFSPHDM